MRQFKQISLLCLLWLAAMNTLAKVYSGDCGANGDNVKWRLDTENGVLVISGEGKMKDYDYSYTGPTAPWHKYNSTIYSVQIVSGVTNIGNYAFCGYSLITSITIPNSVTTSLHYIVVLLSSFFYCIDCISNICFTTPNI